mgnify:CR=1 FL=1
MKQPPPMQHLRRRLGRLSVRSRLLWGLLLSPGFIFLPLMALTILSITGPIYLAVLIGYACTRLGLFAKADMRLFGKFVINLALPALLAILFIH